MRTVQDAMIQPVSITVDKSINDCIALMREKRIDTIFVTDHNNKLLGFVDIEDINEGYRKGMDLIDLMNRDVYRIGVDSKLQDSVRTILKRNIRNIPVIDDNNKLIGLITRSNLVDIVYDTIWGEQEENESNSVGVEQP